LTTSLINLHTKESGKSGYLYYKQKFGDRFEYIGDKNRWHSYIERSIWYNPYHGLVNKLGRVKVVELYRDYISKQEELLSKLHVIKNKVLACWCYPELCHGNVLLDLLRR
jgi:hypothetical protein